MVRSSTGGRPTAHASQLLVAEPCLAAVGMPLPSCEIWEARLSGGKSVSMRRDRSGGIFINSIATARAIVMLLLEQLVLAKKSDCGKMCKPPQSHFFQALLLEHCRQIQKDSHRLKIAKASSMSGQRADARDFGSCRRARATWLIIIAQVRPPLRRAWRMGTFS